MIKMAVHNGIFHADDVFAVAMMSGVFENLEVIRTRDENILEECDLVADVGGGKYDHHQMDKKLRVDGIPYCAFGLLWQDYGLSYIKKNFKELEDEVHREEVLEKVAYEFITQIDAADNGVVVNQYDVPITTISQVISSFMPVGGTGEEVEEGFREAVKFAKTFFYKVVRKYVAYYSNMKEMEKRLKEQPIKERRYLILDKVQGWKEPLLKLDLKGNVLFVIFQDINGSWRVQTVPKEEKSFDARYDLPKAWGGLRAEELERLTGIEGCIFCHPALFICGNDTKEGAIAMAELALKEN